MKVYVLENGVCLAKKKTRVVKKTLDPTYQQPLLFEESPQGKVLQVGLCPPCCYPDLLPFLSTSLTGHNYKYFCIFEYLTISFFYSPFLSL